MPMQDFACAPFILQSAQLTKQRTNVHGGFAGKGREFLASLQHSDQHGVIYRRSYKAGPRRGDQFDSTDVPQFKNIVRWAQRIVHPNEPNFN